MDVFERACRIASSYREQVGNRPVGARASREELLEALSGPLPEKGEDPALALESFARAVDPGLVASAGPRYFGFVTGSGLPQAVAADWLVSAWNQNASFQIASPAAAAVEEVAIAWLVELLGLPAGVSCGFVTGGQTANFTCLLAARNEVLSRAGWDVEARGLCGAPRVRIVAGEEVHVSILAALRMLGFGTDCLEKVEVDGQGRMVPSALRRTLDAPPAPPIADAQGPIIVCAQAGNVNTGAFDSLGEIVEIARERSAWVHVDGAFGLWAAVSPWLRGLLSGHERADSWATDAHKWLNVPYDCGIAFTAHPEAHRRATTASASYFSVGNQRNPFEWVPEASRRGRAIPVYVALRTLGRRGVAHLVERSCALARRMAAALASQPDVTILNNVVLNQVLVRFGDSDPETTAVIAEVQREGTCWAGGTTWQGRTAMRLSISGYDTSEPDVDRSAAAIRRVHEKVAGERRGIGRVP
ncbi:MAG: pyridoxal phosphate-dependent decarboxylase family protein [Myxococcales bacterium]